MILRLENLLTDLKRYRDTQVYEQQKRALEQVTRTVEPPHVEPPRAVIGPTTPPAPAPPPANGG